MTTKPKTQTMEEVGEAASDGLIKSGWKIKEIGFEDKDDYYFDCLYYEAFTKDGILDAFNRLDLILRPLNKEQTSVEITFKFFADPRVVLRVVGTDKRVFGKRVREDKLKSFRAFCMGLLNKAGVDAKEEECEIRSKGSYKDFGDNEYFVAAYEVEVVYWKKY